jgi:hypothetical protein
MISIHGIKIEVELEMQENMKCTIGGIINAQARH